MGFPLNLYIYLAAVLGGCAVSALTLPFWRWWCLRSGHVDDPGKRKIHDVPTPLAGGLAVMTGLVVPVALGAFLLWETPESNSSASSQWQNIPAQVSAVKSGLGEHSTFLLGHGLHRRAVELSVVLLGGLGMLAIGWVDDRNELQPLPKFGGQLVIAALVAMSGVRITLFVPSPAFQYGITVLWFLTVINAFNFMDNMNGLCAGLGAIAAGCFGCVAATHGQYLVALLAFLTLGALLGFLPYNYPRASVFLGDSGSHLVGYLLAALAILPHFYTPEHQRKWAVLIPLLILAVPLLDLVWVVVLRWRAGKPFYVGDTNHLSHRLVRAGWSRPSAVLLIWAIAAALGLVAILLG